MKKLILCEGMTDAILLSYYLGRVRGWEPCRSAPRGLRIQGDEARGESAYWYRKEEDYLLICGVGGKDRFGAFFDAKIRPAIIDSQAFDKMAVVTDRDNRDEREVLEEMRTCLTPVITKINQNAWTTNRYRDSFGMEQGLSFLMLIIPADQEGALETVLLRAISEDPYDQEIVNRSSAFVEAVEPYAKKYIGHSRLKLKARLGVTWAVQSPGKEFHFIDQQIRSVPWEKSATLAQCFCQLIDI